MDQATRGHLLLRFLLPYTMDSLQLLFDRRQRVLGKTLKVDRLFHGVSSLGFNALLVIFSCDVVRLPSLVRYSHEDIHVETHDGV